MSCVVVLFASLVDDPVSRPDLYPTKEAQAAERKRLHNLMVELSDWDNWTNEEVRERARNEVLKSCPDGKPPNLLDPFSGGGTIPLAGQWLGLPAYGGDLNPVAVLIGKAMIEIPPRFANRPPINPEAREAIAAWEAAAAEAGVQETLL